MFDRCVVGPYKVPLARSEMPRSFGGRFGGVFCLALSVGGGRKWSLGAGLFVIVNREEKRGRRCVQTTPVHAQAWMPHDLAPGLASERENRQSKRLLVYGILST